MDTSNGGLMLDHLDNENNSDFVGGPFGDYGSAAPHSETSMMMMFPSGQGGHGHARGVIVAGMDAGHPNAHVALTGGGGAGDDLKLPTAKAKEDYLRKYARKLGVNDRGCYIACGLAILAFLFFIIIIAMATAWPGKEEH